MSSSEHDLESARLRDAREVEYGELPELTRGLRALGSSRRTGGAMQLQFFLPLIEARRRAAEARDAPDSIRAFDAASLGRALDRALERIISEWPDRRLSVRRALRAELLDRVNVYSLALTTLAECAKAALVAPDDNRVHAWRAWTVQLAATFDAADRSWMAVRAVVEALPAKQRP